MRKAFVYLVLIVALVASSGSVSPVAGENKAVPGTSPILVGCFGNVSEVKQEIQKKDRVFIANVEDTFILHDLIDKPRSFLQEKIIIIARQFLDCQANIASINAILDKGAAAVILGSEIDLQLLDNFLRVPGGDFPPFLAFTESEKEYYKTLGYTNFIEGNLVGVILQRDNDREVATGLYVSDKNNSALINKAIDSATSTNFFESQVTGDFQYLGPDFSWVAVRNTIIEDTRFTLTATQRIATYKYNPINAGQDYIAYLSGYIEVKMSIESGLEYYQFSETELHLMESSNSGASITEYYGPRSTSALGVKSISVGLSSGLSVDLDLLNRFKIDLFGGGHTKSYTATRFTHVNWLGFRQWTTEPAQFRVCFEYYKPSAAYSNRFHVGVYSRYVTSFGGYLNIRAPEWSAVVLPLISGSH